MISTKEAKERGMIFSVGYSYGEADRTPFELSIYDKAGRARTVKLDKEDCESLLKNLQEHLGVKNIDKKK